MRLGNSGDYIRHVQSWLGRRRRRQAGGGDGRVAGLDRDPRLWPRRGPLWRNSHADHSRRAHGRLCQPSLAASIGLRDCTTSTRAYLMELRWRRRGCCNIRTHPSGLRSRKANIYSRRRSTKRRRRLERRASVRRAHHLIVARQVESQARRPALGCSGDSAAGANHFISVIPNRLNNIRFEERGERQSKNSACRCGSYRSNYS